MATSGTLLQSPKHHLKNFEEERAKLLELRTGAGVVYVLPSRWQRIRLKWAFRHFQVLPSQVLSRGDQRLIEKLRQTAVVTPALPVAGNTVLGVVEKMRSQPAVPPPEEREAPGGERFWDVRDVELKQWRTAGALAVVCITVVVLASVYRVPLSRTEEVITPVKPAVIRPAVIRPAAATLLPVSSVAASFPVSEKAKHPLPEATPARQAPAPQASEPDPAVDSVAETMPETAAIVAPAAFERPFVAELPQGYFAHPVVTERNLVGELQLKAVIGADGLVKQVTVLSGNPKLAEAGLHAVRQWHYNPYVVQGNPVEVETRIKMSFFGPDAISVASVAGGLN